MTRNINVLDEDFYQDLQVYECLDWDYADSMRRVYDLLFGAVIALGITGYIGSRMIMDYRYSSWQQVMLFGTVAAFGLFLSIRFFTTVFFRSRAAKNPLVLVQKTTILEIKPSKTGPIKKMMIIDKAMPKKESSMEMPQSLANAKEGDTVYVFYIKERKEIIRAALEHQWQAALQNKRVEVQEAL